mgnify:CR=1 FL=1
MDVEKKENQHIFETCEADSSQRVKFEFISIGIEVEVVDLESGGKSFHLASVSSLFKGPGSKVQGVASILAPYLQGQLFGKTNARAGLSALAIFLLYAELLRRAGLELLSESDEILGTKESTPAASLFPVLKQWEVSSQKNRRLKWFDKLFNISSEWDTSGFTARIVSRYFEFKSEYNISQKRQLPLVEVYLKGARSSDEIKSDYAFSNTLFDREMLWSIIQGLIHQIQERNGWQSYQRCEDFYERVIKDSCERGSDEEVSRKEYFPYLQSWLTSLRQGLSNWSRLPIYYRAEVPLEEMYNDISLRIGDKLRSTSRLFLEIKKCMLIIRLKKVKL